MKPSSVKSVYADPLAQRRRVRFLYKISLILILIAAGVGGGLYLLFFHSFMDIRTITFEGLKTINSEELRNRIGDRLEQKYFAYFPRKNNLYFLNTDNISSEILSQYPMLKNLEISKKMPHELIFKFDERIAAGIWCFYNNQCVYFDTEGNTWGPAIKSSGFLIVSVEDKRQLEKLEIDNNYFETIKLLTDSDTKPPFVIKSIIIEQDSFKDIKINTAAGYPILISLDSDIKEQIEILKLFLDKQGTNFTPQYLDLRLDGRVYYKN